MNKTLAVELEDLKNLIIDKINNEELKLWHGSEREDAGWNNALERAVSIIKFEV